MKFELKTDNENYSKSLLDVFKITSIFALIIILCDVSLKLGIIARHYNIYHNCRILYVEKSKSNFKKLSSLSNLKNKQRIWDFCREALK